MILIGKKISGHGKTIHLAISSPGWDIIEEVSRAIEFCKSDDCYMNLGFNGTSHLIKSDSNLEYLTKYWYSHSDDEIISIIRNNKIVNILFDVNQ